MSEQKQRFVGVKSLNSLVGKIKYDNDVQNTEINKKINTSTVQENYVNKVGELDEIDVAKMWADI